jgi:hypothetical protein
MSQLKAQRHLCSQIVTLSWSGGSQLVNMEEIWETGAVLECEESVPAEIHAQVRWDGILLAGRISAVTAHEFGWWVEMEFSPLTPWSPARALPAHLFEIPGG